VIDFVIRRVQDAAFLLFVLAFLRVTAGTLIAIGG
jgi:hypothetical protein